MKTIAFPLVVSLMALAAGPVLAQQGAKSDLPPEMETVQQTNQKIRLLATGSTTPLPADYTLEAGDQIKIAVFDIPELSQQIQIDPAGFISMPLIPKRIQAAGLTPEQLESEIAGLLESGGLVSHPQVSVFVIQRTGQPITVIGAVERPMVYEAVRPTTLLEVLSAAGGLTDTAGNEVLITRKGKSGDPAVTRINLPKLIDGADPQLNIPLEGGDVVAVPRAGIVYVEGAVNRPGGFVIESAAEQMTVLKALALAGGTLGASKPQNSVILRKTSEAGKDREIPVNIQKILSRKEEDVRLLPNDILLVPTSEGKKVLARAAEAALSMTTGIVVLRSTTF